MTAAAFALPQAPTVPRAAIAISIIAHAAALLLLPGLTREVKRLELPPIMASLRALPAALPSAQPATTVPVPAKIEESRPLPRQSLAHPARSAEPAPAPKTAAPRSEAAAPKADPLPERAAPEAGPPAAVAAPQPAPAPATAAQEKVALDDYGRALAELLARQQQYPRLAALRGWEGEVRLRLKVARKGALVAVQLEHSSGHDVLDQAALQMVQATSLPNPPEALGDKEIQVVVPIHYKLQRPA